MREAEAMFGGPVVTNPQEAAAERAKAANAAAAEKAELESRDSFLMLYFRVSRSPESKRQAQNKDPIVQAMKSAKATKMKLRENQKLGVRQNESSLAMKWKRQSLRP